MWETGEGGARPRVPTPPPPLLPFTPPRITPEGPRPCTIAPVPHKHAAFPLLTCFRHVPRPRPRLVLPNRTARRATCSLAKAVAEDALDTDAPSSRPMRTVDPWADLKDAYDAEGVLELRSHVAPWATATSSTC